MAVAKVITRGFGNSQSIVTQGFEGLLAARTYLIREFQSYITTMVEFVSTVTTVVEFVSKIGVSVDLRSKVD